MTTGAVLMLILGSVMLYGGLFLCIRIAIKKNK